VDQLDVGLVGVLRPAIGASVAAAACFGSGLDRIVARGPKVAPSISTGPETSQIRPATIRRLTRQRRRRPGITPAGRSSAPAWRRAPGAD